MTKGGRVTLGAPDRIRVLIVDDDAAIRDALGDVISGAPDLELVHVSAAADDALSAVSEIRPDIAVVDARMMRAGQAAEIREAHPACKILALSAFEESEMVIDMLLAGASGYIVKGASTSEILESIRRTARGQASLSVDMLSNLVSQLVRDVSDRDRSASDLKRRQQPVFDLIEFAPDAVVAADDAGLIVLVNEQTERMFGVPRQYLLGRPADHLLPEQFRDTYAGHRDAYLQERTKRPIGPALQLRGRHADGSEFPIEISLASLDTDDASLVVAFIRDVTERERAAAAVENLEAAIRDEAIERELITLVVRAQDEERVRIAEDVHDDSVQVMTAALMRLQLLKEQIKDPDHLSVLARLEATMQEAIKRLRRLLFVLHPRALDTEGLVPTLRTYLQDLRHDTPIRSQLNDQLAREPSPEVRAALYRIALEGVTNVVKHAHADNLELTLESEGGGVLLRIQDDGHGIDQESAESSSHLGITTMRERAKMAGGRLKIDSTPDGTTVEAWLPDARTGVVDITDAGHPVGAG